MPELVAFGDVADAVDRLSIPEQKLLMGLMRRRVRAKKRARLLARVREAEAEFARGECKPMTVDEIMREIRS